MADQEPGHLSDVQLGQYQDGELPLSEVGHLESCPLCEERLRELEAAAAAYIEYRDCIRGPAEAPAPKPWPSLQTLAAPHQGRRLRSWRWWLVPALAATLATTAVVLLPRRPAPDSVRMSQLLSRSAGAAIPSSRTIGLRLHGRTLLRPAVLTTTWTERDSDLRHLATLFVQANYSWREPLSARSFQAWRSGLMKKRDSVSVIDEGGARQAYRVQTETPAGVLRSASLTLRGTDLRPTSGAFQFQGQDPLEIVETPNEDEAAPLPAKRRPPEVPASPADTLHVLAALDEIGADVGEPIQVFEDGEQQVLVRAAGLSAERRRQVAAALKPLAHVRLDLDSAVSGERTAAPLPGAPERYSTGMPEAVRREFEERVGGPVALQEMTDRVLQASGLAAARAHAVAVLAEKFPPQVEAGLAPSDRELLYSLRQRHLSALDQLVARLEVELRRLLRPSEGAPPPAGDRTKGGWQAMAGDLVDAAQKMDDSVNQLLAGSYSQTAGESMMREVILQHQLLARAVQLEKDAPK